MARLGETIWPDVEYKTLNEGTDFEFDMPVSWEDESEWMSEQLSNQPEEGIKGYIIRFPVADGYAFYRVEKLRPLTLSSIAYGDRWQIPDPHLRGLNRADIEQMVEHERRMAEHFS